MKIEFLPNVNGHKEHVIRIFDFDMAQATLFYNTIQELITEGASIHLADLDFIEPVNCNLSLRVAGYDQGILSDDDHHFFCKMSVAGYEGMMKIIEPYCHKQSRSFSWLYDLDTPIDLLFSAGEFVPVLEDEDEDGLLPL